MPPIGFYILRHIYVKYMLKTANKIFHLQIITKGNNTIIRVHRWQKLGNILQVGRKRKSEL